MDSLLDKKDDNFNYFKEPDWQGYAFNVYKLYVYFIIKIQLLNF